MRGPRATSRRLQKQGATAPSFSHRVMTLLLIPMLVNRLALRLRHFLHVAPASSTTLVVALVPPPKGPLPPQMHPSYGPMVSAMERYTRAVREEHERAKPARDGQPPQRS